jgi:hypothetical protein
MTYGDRKIYLFGGTNGMSRLNDLWFFNLEKKSWHKVHYKSELYPSVTINIYIFFRLEMDSL